MYIISTWFAIFDHTHYLSLSLSRSEMKSYMQKSEKRFMKRLKSQ